jgi:hypothetical protein
LADIGEEQLLIGPFAEEPEPPEAFSSSRLQRVQEEILRDQRVRQSVIPTGVAGLQRIHATRVELDVEAERDQHAQYAYIAADPAISDVVLSARRGLMELFDRAEEWAQLLEALPHVNALRLRSLTFAYEPGEYSEEILQRIIAMNRLRVTNPLRVELETQFVHSSEFSPQHAGLIGRLLAGGVTVYNNILLLAGINDDEEEMKRICYSCRQIGIELYHLYVAGLPVQLRNNGPRPVDASRVIRIATALRRHQSGREIPLYTLRTPLGDADFNQNARFVKPEGEAGGGDRESEPPYMRLGSYDLAYFRQMDPDYRWPAGVRELPDGRPAVPVPVLKIRSNRDFFFLSG